jgi:formylglycine-generating enzyme required for sulfatase activity
MSPNLQPGSKLDQFTLRRSRGPVLGAHCWVAEDSAGKLVHLRLADDPEVQIVVRDLERSFDEILHDQPAEGVARVRAAAPFAEIPYTVEDFDDDAKSLADMMREMSPLPAPAATAVFIGLVKAVMHLHQAGFAHGLIRAENVFVRRNGSIWLAGLGWGRILTTMLRRGSLSDSAAAHETLAYFAPEQMEEQDGLRAPADLYALGVLLFEMTTGHLPEQGRSPSDLNPSAPTFADSVSRRCLAAMPTQRFGEAGEILSAIRGTDTREETPSGSSATDTVKGGGDPTATARDAAMFEDTDSAISAPTEEVLPLDTFVAPAFCRVEAARINRPAPVLGAPVETQTRPLIEVAPFAIGRELVTAHSYALFLRETRPSDLPRLIRLDDYCTVMVEGPMVLPRRGMGFYPVNQVSWLGAKRYCDWLSERLGAEIRLPTAAEWLAAAGYSPQRRYPWGGAEPDADKARYGHRWCNEGFGVLLPVDSLVAGMSPYGARQMSGTLWEWTSDSADDFAGQLDTNTPPPDLSSQATSNGVGQYAPGELRIVCGGSWHDDADDLCLDQIRMFPAHYRRVVVGFRLAAPITTLDKLTEASTAVRTASSDANPAEDFTDDDDMRR